MMSDDVMLTLLTWKMTRLALGEFRVIAAELARPISFSLNMAVFEVPSVQLWRPVVPTTRGT